MDLSNKMDVEFIDGSKSLELGLLQPMAMLNGMFSIFYFIFQWAIVSFTAQNFYFKEIDPRT